jgi:hypothetical protein
LVIAALGLLVLILTLFCMKQQNDYALLLDEYYRQGIEVREIRIELDSAKHTNRQLIFPHKQKIKNNL